MTEVAAFDFDGTISRRDTFVPFLVRVCGRREVGLALAAGAAGARTRDGLKAAVVRRLLRGRSDAELRELGQRFAGEVVRGQLWPEARDRLRWHLDHGHALVLVSASPTAYLDEVGELLGFTAVLSTRLEVGAGGLLTGELVGGNCRGPEKARRVRAWLEERGASVVWAYGDSSGDRELLALAQHPRLVRRGRYGAAPGPPG